MSILQRLIEKNMFLSSPIMSPISPDEPVESDLELDLCDNSNRDNDYFNYSKNYTYAKSSFTERMQDYYEHTNYKKPKSFDEVPFELTMVPSPPDSLHSSTGSESEFFSFPPLDDETSLTSISDYEDNDDDDDDEFTDEISLKDFNRFKFDQLNFLIVDDNQINLSVLSKLLLKVFKNCTSILSTTNSTQTFDLLMQQKCQILFIDIEMPVLSGVDISYYLRQHCQFDELVIVAVTSCVSPQQLETQRLNGIDLTIPKPLSLESLKTYQHDIFNCLQRRNPDLLLKGPISNH